VNHPAVVCVLQPARRLKDVADRGFRVEFAVLLDHLGEGLSAHVLHAEEARAVGLADVVNLNDVRVRELRGGERFAREPRDEHRIAGPPLTHHLECNGSVERELAGEVDRAHPAAPDLVLDGVPAHVRSRHERDVRFPVVIGFGSGGVVRGTVAVRGVVAVVGIGSGEAENV
jgi:hypothetical protein